MQSASSTGQTRDRKERPNRARTVETGFSRPAEGRLPGVRRPVHRDQPPAMQGDICCSMYRTLGAHPDVVDGAAGTRFAVWAPNAADVSVVCNANGWKPGQNRLWGSDSGIWSGFVPGLKQGG